MNQTINRRDLLALMGAGGVVFASGFAGCAGKQRPAAGEGAGGAAGEDFYFLQLSDTHWGYRGPANPEADSTLRRAVAAINGVSTPPDFIVFTGDLTHTTDDPGERRARMAGFRAISAELKVKTLRFLPGEHDASLDRGEAYREAFGDPVYAFDHKGVHSSGKPPPLAV
jgi:hypothetical protein